jgi:hypothetical protein
MWGNVVEFNKNKASFHNAGSIRDLVIINMPKALSTGNIRLFFKKIKGILILISATENASFHKFSLVSKSQFIYMQEGN